MPVPASETSRTPPGTRIRARPDVTTVPGTTSTATRPFSWPGWWHRSRLPRRTLSTVDQAAAAVAVVAFIASEHEAGREADDSEVLFEMLRDTVPEAIAHLAATI